ncbi:MAG: hypothetical protein K0R53_70 [Burkholderiales bacterium]|nr:hypothetical protein [Burkholderiales bacterium]
MESHLRCVEFLPYGLMKTLTRRRSLSVTHCVVLGILLGATSAAFAQVEFEPERGTHLIPKDCRFEPDKARCAEDNRAVDFCRKERDTGAVHTCLRANQSPLVCDAKKSASAKQRCERVNRIYQPCKGKRGTELAACVDQRRTQEKRKK